jgi:Cof subfamily protein (haloacid dehalogenase superfamily)
MLQIIAADLDGTLLDSRGEIDASTASTLREVEAMGLHLVLATGRHYIEARNFRRALNVRASLISSNGARAHTPDGTRIFAQDLDAAIARALVGAGLTGGLLVGAFDDDGWHLSRPCPELDAYSKASGLIPRVRDLASLDGTGLCMVAYLGTTEEIARLRAEIQSRFGEQVCITSTTKRTLEVMAPAATKGRALTRLLHDLDVPASACAAFGDGANDIDMLSMAGRPFVMNGSSPALLAALPHAPRSGSNDEAGVARTLRELLGLSPLA